MYLKSLTIFNFRKFREKNNKVEFVNANVYEKELDNINVAETTTLIIGKNNSGKTTVIKALEKIIDERGFEYSDFNYLYLKSLIKEYKVANNKEFIAPIIEFNVSIEIEEESKDLITNLIPFMSIKNINSSEVNILIRYEVEDTEIFIEKIKNLIHKNYDENLLFNKFLELINETTFKINYYNENEERAKDFKLKDLIELKPIKANNIDGENCLTKAFSKIIKYRYTELFKDNKEELERNIISMNRALTNKISNSHTKDINDSLQRIISKNKLEVLLSADLTFQKLMSNLIKYEYIEKDINIPENQFGLGYTNLMMIIADLIEYMEKYPQNSFNSKINLISIEEPETFMHPQMQELFIKNINDAITTLLEKKHKNINSQLIITTHSAHILNSKIHSGNSFDNINYIVNLSGYSNVINLDNKKITPDGDEGVKDLNFIKKHIKFKASELFFSDAVILVEGITEYTILPYFIDKDESLNKYYISIFNINGAHGLVYKKLLKLLRVPTLIITDLDIKRTKEEKEDFIQITSLENRITTNQTIIKSNNDNDKLNELSEYLEEENIYITYQGNINKFYATSFEEAFILTNYKNELLNNVLRNVKPDIYSKIVKKDDVDKNINNSYKWQNKLSGDKSKFANELLYYLINEDDKSKIPQVPEYIENGFKKLIENLKGDY